MTDKETLLIYRLRQAEETLSDAGCMLENRISFRKPSAHITTVKLVHQK
ncbi:MAG: hypothetical protein FD151_2233 [bacterium]|nr:MAG: hypothetical protein FD151_2233 [bacterium]